LPTISMCNSSPSLPMRYFMTLLLLLWDATPIGCHFGPVTANKGIRRALAAVLIVAGLKLMLT
jgi:hypothetical protein